MHNKSKFVMLILSFVPGLTHYYLGFRDRALIFFVVCGGLVVGSVGLSALTNTDQFMIITAIGLPILWLVALVDAFSLRDRVLQCSAADGIIPPLQSELLSFSNRKTVAVVLSIVPGAGHMYLGLQKQGLQLMSAFFFAVFFMGWLNMSLFLFILPVIWFYSLFDAMHRAEDGEVGCWQDENQPLFAWLNFNHKWLGWGLIGLGALVIFERIIAPFITWEIRNYLQTGIVALILIGSGIKLLTGNKQIAEEEADEECGNGE